VTGRPVNAAREREAKMALFKYRAVDRDGKAVEGTMEEASASRVTGILRERGLQVNAVEEVGKGPGFLRAKSRLT